MSSSTPRTFVSRPSLHLQRFDAAAQLAKVTRAIHEIYARNTSSLSFEEIYRCGYYLVLHRHGEALYAHLRDLLAGHCSDSATNIANQPNASFLKCLSSEWESHRTAFHVIVDIFMYLDRAHCDQRHIPSVFELALMQFRDVVVCTPTLEKRLKLQLLEEIAMERRGSVVDRSLLRSVLEMLLTLRQEVSTSLKSGGANSTGGRTMGGNGNHGLSNNAANDAHSSSGMSAPVSGSCYESLFEEAFLEETQAYYQVVSLEHLSQHSCPEYLTRVEEWLSEEAHRVTGYLSPQTGPKLCRVLEETIIVAHARTLIEMETSGLVVMLRDHRVNDLRRMYSLLQRSSTSLDLLRDGFGRYLTSCGRAIYAASAAASASATSSQDAAREPVALVRSVLELKTKADDILENAFSGDKTFTLKQKESFEEFLNRDQRFASYLASFLDETLRTTLESTGVVGTTVDSTFESALVLFQYISDKDVFESFYRKLLCRRFLSRGGTGTGGAGSGMDEAERFLVTRLKQECGYQFTSKLEGMLVDMQLSSELMTDFEASPYRAHCPVDIHVQLLTTGFWPLSNEEVIVLPEELNACIEAFTSFYRDKSNGRKLQWLAQVGTVDIKGIFPSGERKELAVSVFQACVLMLFNKRDTWTINDLHALTRIPMTELRRHVLSLCTPKARVLLKSSKGKGLEETDEVRLNSEFTSKFKRIKVPLVSLKEVSTNTSADVSAGQAEVVPPAVEEARRSLVDASIVRVMKSRRTVSHNDLIAEVTKQLLTRFAPTPQFIKKRIESLIEREYIRRDQEDNRMYNYLA